MTGISTCISEALLDKTESEKRLTFDRIVVAYDGSASADSALKDAALLAGRYRSEVLIVHIDQTLARRLPANHVADIVEAKRHLTSSGVRHRGIERCGSAGDMILDVCRQENADLLMLGAYGHGRQDRETLGSTAEQLLREIACPVVTYGPKVSNSILERERQGPALFPIALPCNDQQLPGAIGLAKLFQCRLELFYAVPYSVRREVKWIESECFRVSCILRAHGVPTAWTFEYGVPDLSIWSKSAELRSPFILMPLKWRNGLSASTSDNVAAHVIRNARVPVITYRFS